MRHKLIIGTFALSLSLVACRQPPSKPGAISGGGNVGPGGENAQAFPAQVSLTAYTNLIYEPLIAPNCSGCHDQHPYHKSAEESHEHSAARYLQNDDTIARFLFETPKESQIIRKIATNHNCAAENCTTEFLLDAMDQWVEELEATGWKVPEIVYPNVSENVAINTAQRAAVPYDTSVYLAAPASEGMATGGFATPATDDPDGPITSYVSTPLGQDIANQGDPNASTVSFNFDVVTPGDYYLWMRVKLSESTQENAFFVTVGNTNIDWSVATTDQDWLWRSLVDEDTMLAAPAANLPAGPVTVTVQQRVGGSKLNYVMLTSALDANKDLFSKDYHDLEMDISSLAGTNAKLIATVYGENQGPDEVNVVGIHKLRIESDKPLRVKGIKPLVNGVFSPSNSTYTAVDTVVGGSANYEDQVIETGGASGSIILASWEKDKLSFSFESIEVAE